jgi:hypothetical protein
MNDNVIKLYDVTEQFVFTGYEFTNLISFNENDILLSLRDFRRNAIDYVLDYGGNEIEQKCINRDIVGLDEYSQNEVCNYECKYNNTSKLEINYHGLVNTVDINKFYYNLYEFPKLKEFCDHDIILELYAEFNDYVICVWQLGNSVTYIVSSANTEKIISVFIDEKYAFQPGDCETNMYLLDGEHILVWNSGDVCSVVLIKNTLVMGG